MPKKKKEIQENVVLGLLKADLVRTLTTEAVEKSLSLSVSDVDFYEYLVEGTDKACKLKIHGYWKPISRSSEISTFHAYPFISESNPKKIEGVLYDEVGDIIGKITFNTTDGTVDGVRIGTELKGLLKDD